MKDSFVNRLAMFQTTLGTLNAPEYKSIWFEQPPLMFTTKVADVTAAVAALEALVRKQETETRGSAEAKQRAESLLEQSAHLLGSTLAIWFRDQSNEPEAAKVESSISGWRKLRDQRLLEKARMTLELARAVVDGPDAREASYYGITEAEVINFERQVESYAEVVAAPRQKIAERKVWTHQLRDRFNEVTARFEVLDKLILQFGQTSAGRDFSAAYRSARLIRNAGGRPARVREQSEPVASFGEALM